jgi:transcriptional regulator with XRE-family HTH domain
MVGHRVVREPMGLSLTDLSERTGLTRAAISRLENGWDPIRTLKTLFRSREALGVSLKFDVDGRPNPESPVEHGLGLPATAGPGQSARVTDCGRPGQGNGPRANPGKQGISIILKHTKLTENVIDVLFSID